MVKHWLWPIAALAIAGLIYVFVGGERKTSTVVPLAVTPAPAPAAVLPPPIPSAPAPAQEPPEPAPPDEKPRPSAAERVIVERLSARIREFGGRFGGNPEGTNAEIAKALDGGNVKGVRFLDPEDVRLNEKGELLDPWGTPYFFHQLSAREMEIRSAGPDRQMWTEDDPVVK